MQEYIRNNRPEVGRFEAIHDKKIMGETYTPLDLSAFVAKETYLLFKDSCDINNIEHIRVCEPAVGDGRLIEALINEMRMDGYTGKVTAIGFDINSEATNKTYETLSSDKDTNILVVNKDFLSSETDMDRFDIIISNPPYIRTQIIGGEKSKKLAAKFKVSGKIDTYHLFMMKCANLLRENGVMGFITSNKFLNTKSGLSLRAFLSKNININKVFDLGDTRVFESAVLPALLFAGKSCDKKNSFISVYETKNINRKELPSNDFYHFLHESGKDMVDRSVSFLGRSFDIKCGFFDQSNIATEWNLTTSDSESFISKVKSNTWSTFSEIGKVRVGVKTTADDVFVKTCDEWSKMGDSKPQFLHGLITSKDCAPFIRKPNRDATQILYPYKMDCESRELENISGKPDLTYLNEHKKRLSSREYLKKAGREWYEIWVPQKPSLWKGVKIVWKDISDSPCFFLDDSNDIVRGECFWLKKNEGISDDIIYLALAVANSRFIEKYYDIVFNNKLYASRRRFISQYVGRFPIPNPHDELSIKIISAVKRIYENPEVYDEDYKFNIDSMIEKVFSK